MEKREDVASILSKLDLHDIEETISQPIHTAGPGRPPRSPLGIFKALYPNFSYERRYHDVDTSWVHSDEVGYY